MREQLLRLADRIIERRAACLNRLLSPCTEGDKNRICATYLWLSSQWLCVRQMLRWTQ